MTTLPSGIKVSVNEPMSGPTVSRSWDAIVEIMKEQMEESIGFFKSDEIVAIVIDPEYGLQFKLK